MHGFHPTGLFLHDTKLEAIFEPADIEVYRRLIPAPFSVPEHPQVWAYITTFDRVSPWPLTPYSEAAVLLAVQLGETPGWHSAMMSVTKRVAKWGGRLLGGFPKELADIELARTAESTTGVARRNGMTLLEMRLINPVGLEAGASELAGMFRGVPAFHFVPPGRGPKIVATTLDVVSTPTVTGERGMIRFAADSSLSWTGLLPAEVPGSYLIRDGAFILRFGRFSSHTLTVQEQPVTR